MDLWNNIQSNITYHNKGIYYECERTAAPSSRTFQTAAVFAQHWTFCCCAIAPSVEVTPECKRWEHSRVRRMASEVPRQLAYVRNRPAQQMTDCYPLRSNATQESLVWWKSIWDTSIHEVSAPSKFRGTQCPFAGVEILIMLGDVTRWRCRGTHCNRISLYVSYASNK